MTDERKKDIFGYNAISFWTLFGIKLYPNLAEIAIRMLTIPTSSASSERVWSIFSFIHSKRRNRLQNQKVEKLVFIYMNATLLDENDKVDYSAALIENDEDSEDSD
jgi:hypothetical protein